VFYPDFTDTSKKAESHEVCQDGLHFLIKAIHAKGKRDLFRVGLFRWWGNQKNIGQRQEQEDYKKNKTAVLEAFFPPHLDIVEQRLPPCNTWRQPWQGIA
jgi:hypothetical protein